MCAAFKQPALHIQQERGNIQLIRLGWGVFASWLLLVGLLLTAVVLMLFWAFDSTQPLSQLQAAAAQYDQVRQCRNNSCRTAVAACCLSCCQGSLGLLLLPLPFSSISKQC
jgi:hypothetical protein